LCRILKAVCNWSCTSILGCPILGVPASMLQSWIVHSHQVSILQLCIAFFSSWIFQTWWGFHTAASYSIEQWTRYVANFILPTTEYILEHLCSWTVRDWNKLPVNLIELADTDSFSISINKDRLKAKHVKLVHEGITS